MLRPRQNLSILPVNKKAPRTRREANTIQDTYNPFTRSGLQSFQMYR